MALLTFFKYWNTIGLQLLEPHVYDGCKFGLPGAATSLDFVIQFARETLQDGVLKRPRPWSSDMNPADVAPPQGVPVIHLETVEVDIHIPSCLDDNSSQCTSEGLFAPLEDHVPPSAHIGSLSDDDALLFTSSQESVLVPSLMSTATGQSSPEQFQPGESLYPETAELDLSATDQPVLVSPSFDGPFVDYDIDNRLPESFSDQNTNSGALALTQAVIEALLFGTSPCPKGFKLMDSSMAGGLCQLIPSIFNRLYLSVSIHWHHKNSLLRLT